MSSERPRILFVDDDPDLLSGLQRSLRKMNGVWNMLFATSGETALKICKKSPCQVVVTDLSMPGMDGIELVKILNQKFPKTLCIMLTGTAGLQDATELINTTKVFRFYTKPCLAESLAEGVSEALSEATAERAPPSLELLTSLFSLTRSEARLTQALVLGKSLEMAAKEIGVTPSSARTYLKRIFSKTNTNRQAELVSKILLTINMP